MIIKFKCFKQQASNAGMGSEVFGLDSELLPYTHVIIPSDGDYTLCGQATDEYLYDVKKDGTKITCSKCREHIILIVRV